MMSLRRLALPSLIALLLFSAAFFGAAWWQAQRSAPLKPSAVDIGFAQAMSLHHQQAIGMAQLMLDGRPTPLANLARQIAYGQLLELGEMRGWLKLWGAPVVLLKPPMEWMRLGRQPLDAELTQYLLDCARSPTGMTGLAPESEVLRLRELEGRARDAYFLALLLAHHQGGLPMLRFAAAEAALPTVRRLALNAAREQMQEAVLIQRTQLAMAASAPPILPSLSAAESSP